MVKEKTKEDSKKMNSKVKFTILAVILIAIFCIAISPVTLQNDTFYTIKVGEHIANNGIDMQDPFAWHEDLTYTYPHWLYDLITYFIYSAFGMTGIYVTTCILSIVLGITIYVVNSKLNKNNIVSFLLTIGAMYLLTPYIAARAQLVTFILFALTIYFIEKFLDTKKIKYAIGLIIIPILIANLHVAVFPFYFVLYLPYIAEYIIAIIAEFIIYQKSKVRMIKIKINKLSKKPENKEKVKELQEKLRLLEDKIDKIKIKRSKELQNPYKIKLVKNDTIKWLIIIMIICIFTGFLTPLGTTPYTYLQKTMQGNTTHNISEHQPMTLGKEVEVLCTLILLLAPVVFTKVKIRLSDLLMIGGLFYLMLTSRRQLTMFVIIGSVILNRLIKELIDLYNPKEWLETIERKMTKIIPVLIISILTLGLSYYMAKDKVDDTYIDKTSYPVDACDFILENINLKEAKFYNEYNYGSYMIFRGIPVFIDSRADLYAPEFSGKEDDIFMDFIETSGIGKFYSDIFEKYNITHVITYKTSKMNMIIEKTEDKNYNEIYSDDYFVIYERLNS